MGRGEISSYIFYLNIMRSSELLMSFKQIIEEDTKIFHNLFNRPLPSLVNSDTLKKEFFILMNPWLKSSNVELWNVSLKRLQDRIKGSFNQKLRNLTLEIIYTLLIESKRKSFQKLVAKSNPLSITALDYFFLKEPSFDVLKILCAHNKLQEIHFNHLIRHPRSTELLPILAANEGLPQSLIYSLIATNEAKVNYSLISNPKLSLTQKLQIVKNNKDPYVLFLFLEQPQWPDSNHPFWNEVSEKLKDNKIKESLEIRLFFRPFEFPLSLLMKQKKFLKSRNFENNKIKDLNEKIRSVEDLISKHNSSKAKLSKLF